MRQLKFRIWDVKAHKFLDNDGYHSPWAVDMDGKVFNGRYDCKYEPDEYIPQEWSGRTDAEGTDVFEGDYLASEFDENEVRYIYHVSFYEGSWNKPYMYRQVTEHGLWEVVGRKNSDSSDFYGLYKIIGNELKNPFLKLKEKKDPNNPQYFQFEEKEWEDWWTNIPFQKIKGPTGKVFKLKYKYDKEDETGDN